MKPTPTPSKGSLITKRPDPLPPSSDGTPYHNGCYQDLLFITLSISFILGTGLIIGYYIGLGNH